MNEKESRSRRFYRGLIRVLPFDFRREFGGEMELTFQEQCSEAMERNPGALARMWWSAILDIFRIAPGEHLSVLRSDVQYAFRLMKRNAGFTFAAVLILGLGIGANTAIFSVVRGVLLRPLPYADGDRLVVLRQYAVRLDNEERFSVPEIEDYRRMTHTLTDLVEYHMMGFILFGGPEPYNVRTGVVSANFFDAFGVRPILGRTFTAADERPGAQPVLLLSYEFWKQAENGNPDIVGKKYRMNGNTHIAIGVLPPIPQYPNENDVYMPTSACPSRSSNAMITGRTLRMMRVFGRLKPGESVEHCRADLRRISTQLQRQYPDAYPSTSGYETRASLLREDLTREARPMLIALLIAAAFVLVIACANVANLILARMARREGELMIRAAVGAGGGRLLRQLLTESVLLALLAAGVGLVFAGGSMKLLTDFASQITPRAREISMDHGVFLFALACVVFTTVIFGSASALYSRRDLSSGLKEGGRSGTETGRHLARRVLIAAQVAFSFILLIGACLLVRSFVKLSQVNPGFRMDSVYAVPLHLAGEKYNVNEARLSLARRMLERLRMIPGVVSCAVSSSYPLDPINAMYIGETYRMRVEGDGRPEAELPQVHSVRRVTEDYFATLGIPLISGRLFENSDDENSNPVALLSRNLAQKRWGNQDPVGKRVSLDGETWMTVVGVVGTVKDLGLGSEAPYQIYRPLTQSVYGGNLLIRASAESPLMLRQIRTALHEIEPEMAVDRIVTMEEVRARSIASPRTLAHVFTVFAALALAIAAAGIASMLALWVRERIREIGIRMALGASPAAVRRQLVTQGMALVAAGLLVGLAISYAASRFLRGLLFQIQPSDGVTYLLASALLVSAAAVACLLPAARAGRVDPQVALRAE